MFLLNWHRGFLFRNHPKKFKRIFHLQHCVFLVLVFFLPTHLCDPTIQHGGSLCWCLHLALAHLHSLGIPHCNVTLGNALIDHSARRLMSSLEWNTDVSKMKHLPSLLVLVCHLNASGNWTKTTKYLCSSNLPFRILYIETFTPPPSYTSEIFSINSSVSIDFSEILIDILWEGPMPVYYLCGSHLRKPVDNVHFYLTSSQ